MRKGKEGKRGQGRKRACTQKQKQKVGICALFLRLSAAHGATKIPNLKAGKAGQRAFK